MKHPFLRLSALLSCGLLAACGGTDIKDMLGLTHKGPDAFQVYSRPPLTLPPAFNLETPGKGPESVTGIPTDEQAHNKMLSTSDAAGATPSVSSLSSATTGPAITAVPAVSANELPTNADAQFLSNAGTGKADTHIRDEIESDKENNVKPAAAPSPYLLGGKSDADPVVDSTKEADRLKQDKTQGTPPTTGDTPVIVPQDKGILSGIF